MESVQSEDEKLLDYLAEKQIPLELCPLSNVCTGVVKSMDEHPAQKLFQRGLCITMNTDDPKMFGNSLADEYRFLEQRLGFSRQDLRTLILNGISALLDAGGKESGNRRGFCASPDWQTT